MHTKIIYMNFLKKNWSHSNILSVYKIKIPQFRVIFWNFSLESFVFCSYWLKIYLQHASVNGQSCGYFTCSWDPIMIMSILSSLMERGPYFLVFSQFIRRCLMPSFPPPSLRILHVAYMRWFSSSPPLFMCCNIIFYQ